MGFTARGRCRPPCSKGCSAADPSFSPADRRPAVQAASSVSHHCTSTNCTFPLFASASRAPSPEKMYIQCIVNNTALEDAGFLGQDVWSTTNYARWCGNCRTVRQKCTLRWPSTLNSFPGWGGGGTSGDHSLSYFRHYRSDEIKLWSDTHSAKKQ